MDYYIVEKLFTGEYHEIVKDQTIEYQIVCEPLSLISS
jgi:hypothetical protein